MADSWLSHMVWVLSWDIHGYHEDVANNGPDKSLLICFAPAKFVSLLAGQW